MEMLSYFNLKAILSEVKANGLKKSWQVYRWRLVLAVFLAYLVRDVIIYILLPYVLVRSF